MEIDPVVMKYCDGCVISVTPDSSTYIMYKADLIDLITTIKNDDNKT